MYVCSYLLPFAAKQNTRNSTYHEMALYSAAKIKVRRERPGKHSFSFKRDIPLQTPKARLTLLVYALNLIFSKLNIFKSFSKNNFSFLFLYVAPTVG